MTAKAHIIVVEDNPVEREELLLSLQLAGLSAYGAEDGSVLDQLLKQYHVDIVLLDLTLPIEGGLEIAARLTREKSNLGVIMLTGKGLLGDRLQGMNAGADSYFVKPIDPRELVAAISALRRRLGNGSTSQRKGLTVLRGGLTLMSASGGRTMLLSDLQRRLLMSFKGAKLGDPISREVLMDLLGYGKADGDYHRLETLVSRLRIKVRSDLDDELPLLAIAGQGYALANAITYQAD
jgi:DNA-binding response OmpR family regulator